MEHIEFYPKTSVAILWATCIMNFLFGLTFIMQGHTFYAASSYYWIKKLPLNHDLQLFGSILVVLSSVIMIGLLRRWPLVRPTLVLLAGISGALVTGFLLAALTGRLDTIGGPVLWSYLVVIETILAGQITYAKAPNLREIPKTPGGK